MEISKDLDELLLKRTKLAEQLREVNLQLCEKLETIGIDTDTSYMRSGHLFYTQPELAESWVREDLKEKE